MAEPPHIPKASPPGIQDPHSQETLPRPSHRIRREETSAQQLQKKDSPSQRLPQSLAELAALQKELELRGHKIEKGSQALMNFLRDSHGEGMSEEALVSTAALMASLPLRRKEKKKRLRNLYFKWAREKSTVLITKVIHAFRHPGPPKGRS